MARILILKDKEQNTLLETRMLGETDNISYTIVENPPKIEQRDGYQGSYALDEKGELKVVYEKNGLTVKEAKQEENKLALQTFLKNNPLLWTDGKYYGVTQEDQIEMQTDYNVYLLKQSIGVTDWQLKWHDTKKACRVFTLPEFFSLQNAIADYVFPLREKQEYYKEQIFNCSTKEEVEAIEIDYETV